METEVPQTPRVPQLPLCRWLLPSPYYLGSPLYWIPAGQVPNIQTQKRNLEREPPDSICSLAGPLPRPWPVPECPRDGWARLGAPHSVGGCLLELSGGRGPGVQGCACQSPRWDGSGVGGGAGSQGGGRISDPRGGVTRLTAP